MASAKIRIKKIGNVKWVVAKLKASPHGYIRKVEGCIEWAFKTSELLKIFEKAKEAGYGDGRHSIEGSSGVWIGYIQTTERKYAGLPYSLLVARLSTANDVSVSKSVAVWVIQEKYVDILRNEAKKLDLL